MAQSFDTLKMPAASAIGPLWNGFARWWMHGFTEIVPAEWLRHFRGRSLATLTFYNDGDRIRCWFDAPAHRNDPALQGKLPHARSIDATSLTQALIDTGLQREDVAVGVAFDQSLFYTREFSLPPAALPSLPTLLEQDIQRKTPFQPADIWHGARPSEHQKSSFDKNMRAMRHWIIQRSRTQALLDPLGLPVQSLDFISLRVSDDHFVPVIVMKDMTRNDPTWARQLAKGLLVACCIATLAAIVVFDRRQASVADNLEEQLVDARALAKSGGGAIDPAVRLAILKADAGIMAAWAELSRVLPDDTFLTDLRFADGKATVAGFSGDATRLLRLIDRSPLFAKAALTGTITPSATEGKDRFSIAFELRAMSHTATNSAGRGR